MRLSRQFPSTRMRRTRAQHFSRQLTQETSVSAKNLILPLFIVDGTNQKQEIISMPDVFRYSLDRLPEILDQVCQYKIPAIALFPVIEKSKKDLTAQESFAENGLVQTAIRSIKESYPQLGIITDIALDPYTIHGQDGLIDANQKVLNDKTTEVLVKQALSHIQAGADIVAPSDMMDGRIGAIRKNLESNNFHDALILAYAAKYASAFYGPFRDAVDSKNALGNSDKKSYQMNFGNSDEALHEVQLDLHEGADIVMVKPGVLYLDIIRNIKKEFKVPVFSYHVSGEYCMLKAAAAQNWLDEKSCVLETLAALRRAGSDAIFTYYALAAARWLEEN